LPHCVVAVGNADCIHNTTMEPDDREEELEEAASLSQPAKRPRQQPPPPKHQQHLSESGVVSKEQDSYRTAYAGFTYEPIPSTGRPGTPHRFFAESYLVRRTEDGGSNIRGKSHDDTTSPEQPAARHILPVLHKNANGLVVVTVGSAGSALLPSLKRVKVVASEAPSDSLGGKRKKQAKMLKGKSVQHVVQPHDTMAALRFGGEQNNRHNDDDDDEPQGDETRSDEKRNDEKRSEETAHVLCGVWGTVLEVNPNLAPELLCSDPALNGYLAIVLPTGPFPPPATSS
jgi:hypothetical protein